MISNSKTIAEVFARIDHKLDLMLQACLRALARRRGWEKVSSLRLVRIWLPWRRTTRRLVLSPPMLGGHKRLRSIPQSGV